MTVLMLKSPKSMLFAEALNVINATQYYCTNARKGKICEKAHLQGGTFLLQGHAT